MAIKKFDHAVIYNGVFYFANTPIKVVDEQEATEKPTTKRQVKKDDKGTSK